MDIHLTGVNTNSFASINKPPNDTKSSALPLTNQSTVSQTSETDLEAALEQHKATSLVYQLMRAIARANGNDTSSDESSTLNTTQSQLSQSSLSISTSFAYAQQSLTDDFSLEISISHSEQQQLAITSADGHTQFDLSTSYQTSLSLSLTRSRPAPVEVSDPLIVNLDNSDFSFNTDQLVSFDLDADGNRDNIYNLNSGNAFLAYDKNANGIIDDGSELFGDTGGAIDGFADLAAYDLNQDNQIDTNDKIFKNLLLMNFDSQGQQTLSSLESADIQSISLEKQNLAEQYQGGNLLTSQTNFQRNDGTSGKVGDFLLSLN